MNIQNEASPSLFNKRINFVFPCLSSFWDTNGMSNTNISIDTHAFNNIQKYTNEYK